ncbi:MAG: glycoside hydrolase family 130 protein [Bacilli bacterium]|jgi:predicted GH43/DUF377 family glycosyl hydrolase
MKKQLIIRKSDITPSHPQLSVLGIFNPAVILKGRETMMLVRVSEIAKSEEERLFIVPTYRDSHLHFIKIDRFDPAYDFSDVRVIRNHEQNYLTSISHFCVAHSDDGINFVMTGTRVMPEMEYESYGIEDPRITEIDGQYYVTYNAISENGINVALMVTSDFVSFKRLGLLFSFDNKDCVIFPQKIDGRFFAFHRPSKSDFGHLDMWLAESPDLLHWGGHAILKAARPSYMKSTRVGAGAVPFLTERGWLVIYHAADERHHYHLAAMLLDRNDPPRVLMRSKKPLLSPQEDYEKNGFFQNVVFTCGLTRKDNIVTIYYGVCDENIAMCEMAIDEIFDNMEEVNNAKS